MKNPNRFARLAALAVALGALLSLALAGAGCRGFNASYDPESGTIHVDAKKDAAAK